MQCEARMATTIHELMTTIADRVGRETQVILRQRKFTGSSLLQTLVFTFFDVRDFTFAGMAHQAVIAGANVSPQGVHQRLTERVLGFLNAMLSEAGKALVLSRPRKIELLQRFPGGVYLIDSTVINLPDEFAAEFPACGGGRGQSAAALKVQVRIELVSGRCEIQLEAGRHADMSSSIQDLPLPPGSLRLADIGYLSVERLKTIGENEGEFITRMPVGMKLYVPTDDGVQGLVGKPLFDWFQKNCPKSGYQVIEKDVLAGAEFRLLCRAVVIRVPDDVYRRRVASLEKDAKRRNRKVSAEQRAGARWTMFLTNIPSDKATWKEIVILYRMRWQIELLFKLWKTKKNFDAAKLHQQFQSPVRSMIAIYAKLFGVLLRHWTLLATCWHIPALSFTRTARLLNRYMPTLAILLGSPSLLQPILKKLTKTLAFAPRLDKRRKEPSSYQLLTNAEHLTWGLESLT